jgi:hypothetical protein
MGLSAPVVHEGFLRPGEAAPARQARDVPRLTDLGPWLIPWLLVGPAWRCNRLGRPAISSARAYDFRFTAFGKREHVVAPELQRVDLALAVLAEHGGIPGSA